ncbi:MAG: glycosyltransferase family 10 [Blastochloris sp.]|nr:glycosyltransferase family 10 [Blastochloris sp.]
MKAVGCSIGLLTPKGGGVWRGHTFVIDELVEECDAWFVCDGLAQSDSTVCPPNKVVFITAEPADFKRYHPKWLKHFPHIITSQRGVNHPSVTLSQTGLSWFLKKTFDELGQESFPAKTKNLSAIFSTKRTIGGHRRRLQFILALARELPFDCFGRNTDKLLSGSDVKATYHFSSEVESNNKWPGVADYRYSLAIENSVCPDYWTEKIIDCFLAGTVPLYYGCPNIADYFPKDSYILIDINDVAATKKLIDETCTEAEYFRRLPALEEAKRLVLHEYNLFNLISDFVSNLEDGQPPLKVTLYPEPELGYFAKKIRKYSQKYFG